MTRGTASFAYLLVLAATLTGGCVSPVALEGSLCPCGDPRALTCCDGRCVAPGTTCGPGPNGGDGGVGDGDVGDGDAAETRQVTSPFVQIAIGRAHACGVRADGTMACRGDDSKGQATPRAGVFRAVVAGGDHTCAQLVDNYDLAKDRSWVCWGDDSHGEATAPSGPMDVVAAGEHHNCGVVVEAGAAKLKCWGDDTSGQSSPPPLDADVGVMSLAAGRAHTCALWGSVDDRGVFCWGNNARGQTEAPSVGGTNLYQLTAANDHTCLAEFFGFSRCWGDNDHGQSTSTPSMIRELSTASGHTCGIPIGGFRTNQIFCWGSEWGDSTSTPPDDEVKLVATGDWLNCGIPRDPTKPTLCWGKTYEPWY